MGSVQAEAGTLTAAIASLNNNIHYLRSIASMAREREVVVVQEVRAESGHVLLLHGTRVDEHLLDRLAGHRLVAPLDAHLRVSDPVNIAALQTTMAALRQDHPLGMALSATLGEQYLQLERALQQMAWPVDAGFKLTVMKDQLPSLYEHSVLVMMVGMFLAVRSGRSAAQCGRVAAASLLHDVGMLYLPASWMNAEYKLSDEERRQLTAHTVTSSVVVQSMYAYPQSVADAVLEHHEHLDGSGYPRQLKGDVISPMGQILTVAELVAAFYGKYADMASERLSLMFRMHSQRFSADLIHPILEVLDKAREHHVPVAPLPSDEVLRDGQRVATVLSYWASCKRVLPEKWQAHAGARAVMWLDARMRALEISLADSGAHIHNQAEWAHILAHDAALVVELGLIYREAQWQVESSIYNCLRRWPQLQHGTSVVERAVWTWIASSAKVLGILDTLPQKTEQATA